MRGERAFSIAPWLAWLIFAALLAAPPLLFDGGFALTLASQIGIAIILALSYNMLFGQTGLLSFGHAVYSGLGAYAAIYALRLTGQGQFGWPVTLLPLIGGAAGALAAVVLGYVSTRRGGLTFAMISLAIGELVVALAAMLPGIFGGEAGITANRVTGEAILGISYGSARAVCWLIAAWTLACAIAMYAYTRTPLARIANAVRDNPERAQTIGCDPRRVRWLAMIAAGFFAGIAGGLSAILYEIVSAENLGAHASGDMLMATFIGGAGSFHGPVIGAAVFTLMTTAVAAWTPAWPFYLGLLFVATVLYAPNGFAGLVESGRALLQDSRAGARWFLAALLAGVATLAGIVGLVESAYRLAGFGTAVPAPGMLGIMGGSAAAVIGSGVLLMAGRAGWARALAELQRGGDGANMRAGAP